MLRQTEHLMVLIEQPPLPQASPATALELNPLTRDASGGFFNTSGCLWIRAVLSCGW
jgi:hypothetical protein